jgi:uncharacterized protein with von Willebrand factor type A (vWA) domain
MMHTDCDYPNLWRVTYDGGATFIPVCEVCHRFVKPDKKVFCGDAGLSPLPNATCKKCGRTRMHFEGFMPSIHNQDDD